MFDLSSHNDLQQLSAIKKEDVKGFTLLELIVVCTLIGIMLTISVPSLRSAFFTNPLKSTARQVVGTINEVRQKAVRNQEPYNLHFSQIENRIWYEKIHRDQEEDPEENEEKPRLEELLFPESVQLSKIWLKESGISSSSETTLYISKKGYMEHTAILLSDDFDNSLSVQCYPFTDPMTVSDEFPPASL